jgi:hypothetical protein
MPNRFNGKAAVPKVLQSAIAPIKRTSGSPGEFMDEGQPKGYKSAGGGTADRDDR